MNKTESNDLLVNMADTFMYHCIHLVTQNVFPTSSHQKINRCASHLYLENCVLNSSVSVKETGCIEYGSWDSAGGVHYCQNNHVDGSAFAEICFWGLSDIHKCSGVHWMPLVGLYRQPPCWKTPHNCLCIGYGFSYVLWQFECNGASLRLENCWAQL